MFPLQIQDLLRVLRGQTWGFVGCASFESRWVEVGSALHGAGLAPLGALVLFPIDRGSEWENECRRKQEASWDELKWVDPWRAARVEIGVSGAPMWVEASDAYSAVRARADAASILVVDITSMPKTVMFPVINRAMADPAIRTLIAVYTEAQGYRSGALHSEPTSVAVIPPFDYLPVPSGRRESIVWVPILGFDPYLATTVHESLAGTYSLADRVFPVVGFPAQRVGYYERVLAETASALLAVLGKQDGLRDRLMFAHALDPFETRDVVLAIAAVANAPCVGSPMGSKPMSLGMLLAARTAKISIVVPTARSYHPDYSFGRGDIHAYVLKVDGAECSWPR